MLTAILSILSSNAVGSLFGWVAGWLNKKEEFKVQQLQFEDKKHQRDHELALRDKDAEMMKLELAGKEKIQVIQTEGEITKAAFGALAASYEHDSKLKGSPVVESFRAVIRPALAIWFTVIATIQTALVLYVGFFFYDFQFDKVEMFELVKYCVQWLFFQGGVCIGWYFATRNSDAPPKLGKSS
jgi:hypothetical protein